MPFVLLIIGVTLLFASINNTQGPLFALVQGDFTGPGSFVYWLFSIAIVGTVGYVPQLRTLSHAFLALILVVLILHQDPQKLFGGISNALSGSTIPVQPGVNQSPTTGGGGLLGALTSFANTISSGFTNVGKVSGAIGVAGGL